MTTICEEAAAQTAWDRHVDQAFAILAPQPERRLLALEGGRDDLTAPSSAHPASRALSRQGDHRG